MNIYEKKAIELRYMGYTYPKIAEAIGNKISISTLRQWFMMGGRLYHDYLSYQDQQDKFTEEDVRSQFKKAARHGVKVMETILQKALAKGDYKLALEVVKEQMDRGGVVTVRQSKVNIEDERKTKLTDEQYLQELQRLGIDRTTGLRLPGFKPAES